MVWQKVIRKWKLLIGRSLTEVQGSDGAEDDWNWSPKT